jgi:hypothetical protein
MLNRLFIFAGIALTCIIFLGWYRLPRQIKREADRPGLAELATENMVLALEPRNVISWVRPPPVKLNVGPDSKTTFRGAN